MIELTEEEADMIINAFATSHNVFGLKKPEKDFVLKVFNKFPVLQKHHYTFLRTMET